MDLKQAAENILEDVKLYLQQLDDERYKHRLEVFSGSSVGMHTRHIIEFYQCLIDHGTSRIINYDKRDRNRAIEEDTSHTIGVIHDLLENISFTLLAKREDISQQRDAACLRYGLKIDAPDLINELLYQTVNTTLSTDDADFYLANIAERNCLKEMPFYLSLVDFSTGQINDILQDCPAFQSLSDKQMQGYLTGFIDLIFVYQERYYVVDYKSNTLGDYQPESLTLAMREHNYGLQYWLYSVVLHQYLQKRLPDYQFSEHFGGVRYLFVRGMQADQAMSGVYSDTPDEQRINELVGLFADEGI